MSSGALSISGERAPRDIPTEVEACPGRRRARRRLRGSVSRPGDLVEDLAKILEIVVLPAQESRQQEMGELDRALLSIRNDEDDIDLGEQRPELLHLPELFQGRGRENRDRIGFYGRPESLPEVVQAFKALDATFRDRLMNCGLKSLVIFGFPTRIKKKLHGRHSQYRLHPIQKTCQIRQSGRSALYGGRGDH